MVVISIVHCYAGILIEVFTHTQGELCMCVGVYARECVCVKQYVRACGTLKCQMAIAGLFVFALSFYSLYSFCCCWRAMHIK